MVRPGTQGKQDIFEFAVIVWLNILQVQKTWGKEICRQGWGSDVRARVFARKRLGREPKAREVEELSEEGGKQFSVTPDDIMAAFANEEEV